MKAGYEIGQSEINQIELCDQAEMTNVQQMIRTMPEDNPVETQVIVLA